MKNLLSMNVIELLATRSILTLCESRATLEVVCTALGSKYIREDSLDDLVDGLAGIASIGGSNNAASIAQSLLDNGELIHE